MRRSVRSALLFSSMVLSLGCPSQEATEIGAVLPLTGEHQLYGQSVLKGIELAFEDVVGDEATSDWVLSVQDSESDPVKSAELVGALYDAGATAVIGGVVTDEALASVTVADRYSRVLLSPSASSAQLTGASKNFYRVFISDSKEGRIMAQFAVNDLTATTAVVLARQTNYARGLKDIFQEAFIGLEGELLDVIEYPTGSDLTGLIERAVTVEPDVVYLAGYADDVASMIEGLRERQFAGSILTTSAFATPEVMERVGSVAEGVFLTQTDFDPAGDNEAVARFVNRYARLNGTVPDLYSAHGFDALKVLAAGIVAAQGQPREVWSGLRSLREVPGVTGMLQFDEKGDVGKFPRVYRIHEGALVDHKKWLEEQKKQLLIRWQELRDQIDSRNG